MITQEVIMTKMVGEAPAKTIDEVAAQHFKGNLAAMARANGVTPQLLARWKARGYKVVSGVLYSPLRELVDANGERIRD